MAIFKFGPLVKDGALSDGKDIRRPVLRHDFRIEEPTHSAPGRPVNQSRRAAMRSWLGADPDEILADGERLVARWHP
jgi:hypothetical protein